MINNNVRLSSLSKVTSSLSREQRYTPLSKEAVTFSIVSNRSFQYYQCYENENSLFPTLGSWRDVNANN